MAQTIINEPVPTSNPAPFAFEGHQIRTVVDEDGNPWFVAKDICEALGINWSGAKTLAAIPDGWKRVGKVPTQSKDNRGGFERDMAIISEPAVYKLSFRSNKPEADRLTNWLAAEVLPSLRRTGKYEVCPTTPPALTTITPSQQQDLQNIVAAKASAYPKEALGRVRAQLWSRLHNKFKVAKYDQLPAAAFPEAVEYLVGLAVRGAFPEALPDAKPPKALPTVKALPGRRRITELDQADIARRLGLLKQRTNRLILEYFEFTRELHQPFNDVACDKENYDPDVAGMMTAVNYGLQYFNRVACGNLETMQSLAEFATHAVNAFRKVEHLPASGAGR